MITAKTADRKAIRKCFDRLVGCIQISQAEVSRVLGVSDTTVASWIRKGKLKGHTFQRTIFSRGKGRRRVCVTMADLEKFLLENNLMTKPRERKTPKLENPW